MKKLALALAVVMIFSLAFSGCGPKTETPSAPGADTTGGTELAVCIGPDPETIDPALNSAVDGASLIVHGFEGLMTLDQGGAVVPGQADTYEVSDDGLNWTFHLRDGLKWSDGQPLTAADFEWSWKRAVSPDTAAPYGEFFNVIAGYDAAAAGDFDALQVKAEDDQTLTVTLAAPCGYFTQLLAFPTYVPVRRDMIEANGEAWATQVSSYIGNDQVRADRGPERGAHRLPERRDRLREGPALPGDPRPARDRGLPPRRPHGHLLYQPEPQPRAV